MVISACITEPLVLVRRGFSHPQQHSFSIQVEYCALKQQIYTHMVSSQRFTHSMHQNKTLTTDPFNNTCEADEVSPEVEAGVVAGLKCLQP
jgi:hypothetical protein